MALPSTPRTLAEAKALQYSELSAAEIAAVPVTHGAVNAVAQDCMTLPPNSLCSETACVNGTKVAFYCDDTGGCTKAVIIPC